MHLHGSLGERKVAESKVSGGVWGSGHTRDSHHRAGRAPVPEEEKTEPGAVMARLREEGRGPKTEIHRCSYGVREPSWEESRPPDQRQRQKGSLKTESGRGHSGALGGCRGARPGFLRTLEGLLEDTVQTGPPRGHLSIMPSLHFFTRFPGRPWAGELTTVGRRQVKETVKLLLVSMTGGQGASGLCFL